MKASCVYYDLSMHQFNYLQELVDFDSVGNVDYEHCTKMYFHATRDLDRADYEVEMRYAANTCDNCNHMLKVSPYALFEDSIVICKDCNLPFMLTAREKDWYNEKQFSMPCRCKPCRDKRRQSSES